MPSENCIQIAKDGRWILKPIQVLNYEQRGLSPGKHRRRHVSLPHHRTISEARYWLMVCKLLSNLWKASRRQHFTFCQQDTEKHSYSKDSKKERRLCACSSHSVQRHGLSRPAASSRSTFTLTMRQVYKMYSLQRIWHSTQCERTNSI